MLNPREISICLLYKCIELTFFFSIKHTSFVEWYLFEVSMDPLTKPTTEAVNARFYSSTKRTFLSNVVHLKYQTEGYNKI